MLESLIPELLRLAGPRNRIRLFAGRPIQGPIASLMETEPSLEAETYRSPSLYLWQQFSMGRAIERFSPSVHLAPEGLLPPGLKSPAVGIVHDLLWLRHPESCKWQVRAVYRARFKSSLKRLAAVHYDSSFTRSEVRNAFPGCEPEVSAVVPLGVSRASFHPPTADEQEELGAILARHELIPPYLLAVGNVRRHKNLEIVLKALTQLHESGDAVPSLAIIGAGPLGAEMEALRTRLPPGAVRPLGYLEERELQRVYQGAGLFVFPSLYEGFGLPLLEAMACGVPVLYARTSALPEVAADAGLAFDPRDDHELANAMSRALNDAPLQKNLIHAGIERAQRFTWRQTAEALWSTLEAAARDSG